MPFFNIATPKRTILKDNSIIILNHSSLYVKFRRKTIYFYFSFIYIRYFIKESIPNNTFFLKNLNIYKEKYVFEKKSDFLYKSFKEIQYIERVITVGLLNPANSILDQNRSRKENNGVLREFWFFSFSFSIFFLFIYFFFILKLGNRTWINTSK